MGPCCCDRLVPENALRRAERGTLYLPFGNEEWFCAGDGHLRRELRHGRKTADRAAEDRREQQIPADLDRASRGGGDPDEAPGRLDAEADDPRPPLRHAR